MDYYRYRKGNERSWPPIEMLAGKRCVPVDLSQMKIQAIIKHPDSEPYIRDVKFYTDGTDGRVVVKLDREGEWSLQYRLEKDGDVWHTSVENFTVSPSEEKEKP